MSNVRLKKITIDQSPLIIQNGNINITNTTISSSSIIGNIVSNGGIAINCTYNSVSSTAGGSLTVSGGVGIMKNVFVGNNLTLDSGSGIFNINGLSENRLFLDNISNKNFYISPDGVNKRLDLFDTYLKLNITQNSVNSSTGALYILGGVSIGTTENVINGSSGGALTVGGGVAIGKDLNVSKKIFLGEQYSNNSALVIRYTGLNQIQLQNSTGSNSSSINMIGNDLNIQNDNVINIKTNDKVQIKNNDVLMLSVQSDKTDFSKKVIISDTTNSINASTSCLILTGGQNILTTQDTSSPTSGGALTIYGGLGVNKKILTGDSVGIDVLNTNKANKLVLFQENMDLTQNNNFSGFGNSNNGSIRYQVNSNSNDHIFYAGISNANSVEIFRIKGTNEVIFGGLNQKYSIVGGGDNNNSLSLISRTPGLSSSFNLYTSDGDGTDNCDIKIYGNGLPNDVINSEYVKLGWDVLNSYFLLTPIKTGNGLLRNFVIQSEDNNKLIISNGGYIQCSSTIISSNATTGAFILNGGVSINNTTNSINVNNGGALTISGGASILKDVLIGGKIKVNANTTSEMTLNTSLNNTWSNLEVIGTSNKVPSFNIVGDSSVNNNKYASRLNLFSLGSNESNTNYECLQLITNNTNGYSIQSANAGNGIKRFIHLTSNSTNYIILQTSGNIGINTLDPNYNLDINGSFKSNNLVVFSGTKVSSNASTGNIVISGGISINSSQDADCMTVGGTITTAGGVSIAKKLFVGGVTKFLDLTPSTSYSIGAVMVAGGLTVQGNQNATGVGNGGALTVEGGASIGGDFYVGGTINGSGSTSSTFAYLTLTATDEAVNFTSGALVTFGGITIQCTTNSSSITDGGSLLVQGGGSFGGDLYIGRDVYNYGITNYISNNYSNDILNFYDSMLIKRFAINFDMNSHNLGASRYDSLGGFIENIFDISNSNGIFTFYNTTNSTSNNEASVIVEGGLSINSTKEAISINNGGGLSLAGGASIKKNVFIGGDVVIQSTNESNDVSSGSLVVYGGVGLSGNLNVKGNTLIVGNLTVNGTTTSIESNNTVLKDNILVLNSGPSGSKDAGFIVQRYQTDNNTGVGDIVEDNYPIVNILPDQTGLSIDQIKLGNTANSTNNYYNNWWIKISSGFSNNQVRKIISYNGTSKVATVSSAWTTQNPSIGDNVYLFNKPYVGIIYNEMKDRFEFGSTVEDPGQNNILFTDNIPICFSRASSTSTEPSTNSSSGAMLLSGGISISNTQDADSLTRGGTITTLGGVSIGKTLYVGTTLNVNGVDMTPNPKDKFKTFVTNIYNNQSSFSDIFGASFDYTVWGFDIYLACRITASNNLYTNFHLRGVNKSGNWEIIKTYVGDDTGIEFSITSSGQLQYTTPNYNGFTSGVFRWRAFVN